MAATMALDIVTAERMVFSDEVTMVIAPGAAGELGILPRHIPLLTTLKPGVLRVQQGSEETLMAVGGGFMEVRPERVTILATAAEHAEEIDEARAEEARRRAEAALQDRRSDADAAQIQASLLRAAARLRVVELRRSTRSRRPQQPVT
jgi:F-type H+-transporting ATPase subunit epsilon